MTWRRSIAAILMMVATNSGLAQDVFQPLTSEVFEQTLERLQSGYAPYQPISYWQNPSGNVQPPAAGQPAPPVPRPNPPANPLANTQNRRPTLARLSRSPDMFGDGFTPLTIGVVSQEVSNVGVTSQILDSDYEANVPLGGGSRRFKNEQTRALPTDRALFVYNHFHNAAELKRYGPGGVESDVAHIDQYTLGFEKTFDEGHWSVEFRMPMAGDSDLVVQDIQVDSGSVGNLAVTLKRLLYSSDDMALAAGLAVTAPTGSDTDILIPALQARFTVGNDAVHLLPYAAVQFTPDENWFFHGFAQVDVAANSNTVTFTSPQAFPQTRSGSITEQTLMYLDVSAGYWWYRSDDDDALTGLASVLEFHYTTTLNDAHNSSVGTQGFFNVGNSINRFDVVNMTVGVHTEWWRHTALRTAAVVPLANEENRFFDSELQVSLIRRF